MIISLLNKSFKNESETGFCRFGKRKQKKRLRPISWSIITKMMPFLALVAVFSCSNDASVSVFSEPKALGECRGGGAFAFVAPQPKVAISNDPNFAVANLTLGKPGVVQIVSLKTNEATNIVPPRDDIIFQDIALSPDGKYLATILTPPPHSGLGEIWITSLADGSSKVITWSPGRLPKAISFSADGKSIIFFRDVDPTPLPSETMLDECRVRLAFSLFEVNFATGVESRVAEQAWDFAAAVWPIGGNPDRFVVTAGSPLMKNPSPYYVSRGEFWTQSPNRVRYESEPWWRSQIIDRGVEPKTDRAIRFLTNEIITDQAPHGQDSITLGGKLHSVTSDGTALVKLFWTHGYAVGSTDSRDGFYLVHGENIKKLPKMDFEGNAAISPNSNLVVKINRIADDNPDGSSEVLQVYDSANNYAQLKLIKLRPTTKSLVLETDDRSALK